VGVHEGRAAERRAQRRGTRWRKVLRGTAWTVAFLLVVGGVSAFAVYRKLNGNITTDDITAKLGPDRPAPVPADAKGQKPLNILLIGSDSRSGANKRLGGGREGSQRSDTTILLHLAGDRRHATALSFARDTLVDVPSCVLPNGRQSRPQHLAMFNSAFSLGGTACTVKTIEKLTDIRVDHQVVIDFSGFANMVDAIGGVPICLPKAVNDNQGHIHLAAGRRVVRGDEALDYVRLRHDTSIGGNGGDLGRIKRQQAFLSALASKVRSTGVLLNPPKLIGLLNAATGSLTTDPGLGNLTDLAALAQSLRGLDTRDIAFVTVPVHPYPPNPNRLQVTQPVAHQLFAAVETDAPLTGGTGKATGKGTDTTAPAAEAPTGTLRTPPSQVRVRVLNGTATPGKARRVAAELRRVGFHVVAVAAADRTDYRTSLARYPASRDSSARTLAAAVPGAELRLRGSTGSTGSTVSLVVGRDLDASAVRAVKVATSTSAPRPPTAPRVETRTADTDICRQTP
jgi:LCP family protein required for cell wall assembly